MARKTSPSTQPAHCAPLPTLESDIGNSRRNYYTARELVGLRGMPGTVMGVMKKAEREKWGFRKRQGRGGGKEYPISALPPITREAITHRIIESAPALPVPVSDQERESAVQTSGRAAPPAVAVEDLTDKDRECMAARAAILAEVRRLGAILGSTQKAVQKLVDLATAGQLPEHLQDLARCANARKGVARTLSRGTVYRWLRLDTAGELAPRNAGCDYTLEEDVAAVLALYRQPNKPALAWCSKQVAHALGVPPRPLYRRVRHFMKKLPSPLFNVGRHTGAALKATQPCRRREFLQSSAPNHAYVGDGHGAKLKVAHPVTGSPFVPEVTAIMDIATRYIVGWSVSLSENCLAVSDALRHAISRHGVPLVYYSDGGGGQTNRMFDAPVTGTLGMLGIHHEVGRPGNPQGRGVIERFWQTVLISLARRFATFQGGGADRDTLRAASQEIDKALRASKRGEVVALPRKLPTWQQFIDAVEAAIHDYNELHQHRSLPKLDGVNHATPAEYRAARIKAGCEIHAATPDELATLFMPAVIRKATRGEVLLWNGIYFHRDLMLVDGEDVKVCYDVHDASRVWVRKITGELIAIAELNGNRAGYFPKPLIERLAEQRAQRRRGRLELQIAEVDAELAGAGRLNGVSVRVPEPAPLTDEDRADQAALEAELAQPAPQRAAHRKVVESDEMEIRYRRWYRLKARLDRGEQLGADDASFYRSYGDSDEWRAIERCAEEWPHLKEA